MARSEYTDAEILSNRRMVIEYLKTPGLKKAKGRLAVNDARCCLGHMCDAFGLSPVTVKPPVTVRRVSHVLAYKIGNNTYHTQLPDLFKEKLGMFTNDGQIDGELVERYYRDYRSLSFMNDYSNMEPADIAAYLEERILGGNDSPWKKIKE